MDKSYIYALVNSLIEKKIGDIDDIRGERGMRGQRGSRGPRGFDGENFNFQKNKDQIDLVVSGYIDSIKDSLKLKFSDISSEEKSNLKLSFDDLTDSDISKLRGPRGLRGQKGKSINWDDIKSDVLENIENLYSETKHEFKLRFSDLEPQEVDDLKLKFSDLTESEILSLKGSDGERGPRGLRGQKGRQGDHGLKGDQGQVGPRGKDGIRGLPGVQGLMGLKGRDGSDGKNGKDAPEIIEILTRKSGKSFYFIFKFNNGFEQRTNKIPLPDVSTYIQQSIISSAGNGSGGTGSLEFFSDGISFGEFEKLDFINATLEIDPIDPTKLNVTTGGSIPVFDEGDLVTSQATSFNFIGEGVQVLPEQKISDWNTLADVDVMATFGGDPNRVEVLIDNTASSVATINDNTFTEIKVVSNDEDINKRIILEQTPTDGQKVIVDIVGGTSQIFGVDFNVTNNILEWTGLGMETIIDQGDTIRINYVI